MSIRIYHNPKCSKSRQTITLLKEKGIDPEIIEYLKTPPESSEIRNILDLLGLAPREIMRTKETTYNELNLDNPDLSDDELISTMVENPILIERPIVLANGKAAIGRPPENILDII